MQDSYRRPQLGFTAAATENDMATPTYQQCYRHTLAQLSTITELPARNIHYLTCCNLEQRIMPHQDLS